MTKAQRSYLRRLANPLKPTVFLGKQGLTPELLEKAGRELDAHELIKVRLLEHKELKESLARTIVDETGAALVSIVGHVITIYRQQADPERRRITLPGPYA
ncbi:MAG: YhbY family RNA-binding protein [Chloroflexales bacterium]|nr:YhbY family RNA-binding protein [Chloroflexales bacterium]